MSARRDFFARADVRRALAASRIGLEREALRARRDGRLALTPHPAVFGDPLEHERITTDFSESQLELITPALVGCDAALGALTDLHRFVVRRLPRGERLWPSSMPCILPRRDEEIPLARYADSAEGRLAELYRHGLALRYGRRMEMISGVHFNYSFAPPFWDLYRDAFGSRRASLEAVRNAGYLSLIRNLHRMGWLIVYLFGASPLAHTSFHGGRSLRCRMDRAVSLRMSRLGYANSRHCRVWLPLDNARRFARELDRATRRRCPRLKHPVYDRHGRQLQVSDAPFQLESEYYAVVRPKQAARGDEKLSRAILRRGIGYVELRALDCDPLSPTGVTREELLFCEILLLHCLATDSAPLDRRGAKEAQKNHNMVGLRGRDSGLELHLSGRRVPMRRAGLDLLVSMAPEAEALDRAHANGDYSSALAGQISKMLEPEELPSTRFLRRAGRDFIGACRELAEAHRRTLLGAGRA